MPPPEHVSGRSQKARPYCRAYAFSWNRISPANWKLLAGAKRRKVVTSKSPGYLYNNGHTPAWVDVLIPGRCWISLDPTHTREQTGPYLRVAVGRDYADVPPTRG